MTEVYMIALSKAVDCSRIDTRSRGDEGCRNSPAVVMQEPRRKSGKFKLVFNLFTKQKQITSNGFTYQAEVNFNSCCEKNRPSFPGGVVGADHTLPNVRCPNRTSDIDENSQSENRHHSKSLSSGQFQLPDQGHGQDRSQDVGQHVDNTRREHNRSVIHTGEFVLRVQIPVCVYWTLQNIRSRPAMVTGNGWDSPALENTDEYKQSAREENDHHAHNHGNVICRVDTLAPNNEKTPAEP